MSSLSNNHCAFVNAHLVVSGHDVGKIQSCLCDSDLPSFITTNSKAQAAVGFVGASDTIAALQLLIVNSNSYPGHACTYPAHSMPNCNILNPCGFECMDGFTPNKLFNPDSCVCKLPNIVCNGKCGNFQSCSSTGMKKRSLNWWEASTCDSGLTACGVLGARRGYDCVDTHSDLWSCGGCTIPLHKDSPVGKDCTAIEGAENVQCFAGSCVVETCKKGYHVSDDETTCVKGAEPFWGSFNSAEYGLEHQPL